MNLFKHSFLILILAWQRPCLAEGVSENRVISAYVLNFAKFVNWPAETIWIDNKINLCVIGRNVLDGALFELDRRKIGNRELHVILYGDGEDKLSGCHMVYIGKSEQRRVSIIMKTLGESPILSISNIEDFAENGGAIGLIYNKDKIAFEINLKSIQRQNLHLPAQLLKIASRVF